MTKPFIRAVREDDFEDLVALAQKSGGGMTNLPARPDGLQRRIEIALESYAAKATKPGPEMYILVLEVGGVVRGTSAIFSTVGNEHGFVNYRINRTMQVSTELGKKGERRLLTPTHDFTGAAEVGSLFLDPSERGGGLGKLVARSRYLFIAQRPEIFAETLIAELRGWRAPDGGQPFWDALGRQFFDMDFEEADAHNAANGNQFIADLMPPYPIYVALLPKEARDSIGKPHDNGKGAVELLEREGFRYDGYIDVFDGGPVFSVATNKVRTLAESQTAPVCDIVDHIEGRPTSLAAAGVLSTFRSARAVMKETDGGVVLDAESADALNVTTGDFVRWTKW
ncbi:MAG: arginine N-succinyltransferase [Pseudomonadota bacterium]